MTAQSPVLMTRQEAADLAGVGIHIVDNWTHRRDFPKLPHVRGGRVWIHRAKFLAWLDQLAATDTAHVAIMRRRGA